MSHVVDVGTLTILAGQTDSGLLSALLTEGQRKVLFGSAVDIVVFAPAALTGTVNPQFSPSEGGTMETLQSGGSDVTLPAAKATSIGNFSARDMRIHSGSAEAADRAFIIRAVLATTGS